MTLRHFSEDPQTLTVTQMKDELELSTAQIFHTEFSDLHMNSEDIFVPCLCPSSTCVARL